MVDVILWLVFALHLVVLVLLFTYGLNILYLAGRARKLRGADPVAPPLPAVYPQVTVQIPVYNERYVVRRTLEAICALDWQPDRLEIQILDDSTDDTSAIIATFIQQYSGPLNLHHIRRDNRTGFKAGALAAGMLTARGEFIAIFDADFQPAPDFLHKTVPHFADKSIGFVQTRWGYLNGDVSMFTQLQALSMDGHFMLEQYARQRSGFLMNFNGTAGVWRRRTIEEAGGWQATTLTEDLDLSYRAQLAGWKPLYLRDVVVPGEIPVTVNAYRKQQYRWARGSWECAMRLLPQVWRSDQLPRWTKIQATLHLTGYGIHLLMISLALMYPLLILLTMERPIFLLILVIISMFNITAAAPTLYYALAQHEKGENWRQKLPVILFLNVMGAGIMVNNARAVLHAMFSRRSAEFERTPKFGDGASNTGWMQTSYKLKINPIILLEGAMLLYNVMSVALAIWAQNLAIFFYAAIFAAGLAFILSLTLWQSWQVRQSSRRHRRVMQQPAGSFRTQ